MSAIVLFILMAVYESNQQDPSLDTNAWLEKYDKYRKIIEENTEITNEDNLTPEIRLHLITPRSKLWNAKSRDSPFKDSPFFAFYWAGGQGLTRYILDHPEIVKGKRVLDLGSGCGATAIAAAKCGAKSVTANDIDPRACIMIDMNAKVNKVKLHITPKDLIQQTNLTRWDVVLVSGVWYKYEELTLLVSKLKMAFNNGKSVYLGDPSGTIKLFANENEFKTVAEYELSEYTFKLIGFKETEVLKLRHYLSNEEKIVEKYKFLLDGLNMSMFW
ncbi:electron transfer flavoprotein beta subunit lysine methyltransferase-like isoform X3 [Macrosteles quadrilineatus]|uniref:electron transfer flavoprotein beta subunit lysine methyltransferase-like isoform X3 n=1 Tax=Macrosteles quadrilineatus TaxID=74068 RepID=UPI0023E1342D|nr:electron transfer flavoprotein beta subunit lysine methyltransferase-like isoform X3 [Macrosteles quadrilineatus]